ncbi:MAG: metalloprotease family protein [Candidatus Diapherotrites archaeon]
MVGRSFLFPGVLVHELSHAIGCWISGIPIHKVEVTSTSGKVIHDRGNVRSSILISIAPLFIGTILAIILYGMGKEIVEKEPLFALIAGWAGFAIAFHSIPSSQDMTNVLATIGDRFRQLLGSSTPFLWKIGKGVLYAAAWVIMGLGTGLAVIANATILIRVMWGILLIGAA